MKKVSWLYHRLRAMSLKEIAYRVNQKKRKIYYQKKYKRLFFINEIPLQHHNLTNSDFVNRLETFLNIEFDYVEFNQLYTVFNKEINLMQKINWHQGTEGSWPDQQYSHSIEFKNKDEIGDVRFTWELNRHQFLPYMAIKYKETKDIEILNQIKFHFYDWVKENPFLKGVNWASSMEIALRAYQWLIVLRILIEEEDKDFLNYLVNAIVFSINHVMNNLSLYSSANNHLILEVAISSMIGYCLYPIYKQNWFKRGYHILEEQIPLQVFEDGVNKEQAVHYHGFVLDMMLQYNFFLRKNNIKPIHEKTIFNSSVFLGYLALGGNVPEIGDSDDAKIIYFGKYSNYYTYLLELASVYFKEKLIKFKSPNIQVKMIAAELFDDDNIRGIFNYSSFKAFSDGGYAIFNNKNNFLVFDCGPLGFGSIAAHGHADALSFVYHYNNKPVFIDSGTYIYNVQNKWRDYFRKTSSHNTLTYKGLDQSDMKGPFLWGRKTDGEIIDSGSNDTISYIVASHDGYKPNMHKRAITYMKSIDLIIIADYFSETAVINFTLSPSVGLKIVNENNIVLDNEVFVHFSQAFKTQEKHVSTSFMKKEETKGLLVSNDFNVNPVVYTLIGEDSAGIKDGIIYYKDMKFVYNNYKDIRGM